MTVCLNDARCCTVKTETILGESLNSLNSLNCNQLRVSFSQELRSTAVRIGRSGSWVPGCLLSSPWYLSTEPRCSPADFTLSSSSRKLASAAAWPALTNIETRVACWKCRPSFQRATWLRTVAWTCACASSLSSLSSSSAAAAA